MNWPISVLMESNRCPYKKGQFCSHEDGGEMCAKSKCPLFLNALPFSKDTQCGCTKRGAYLYGGMWQCPDCLYWWIKRHG
jgi:hypothetical protein